MTTALAAAQARAAQATADREKAERALARVMRRIDRTYDPVVFPVPDAIGFRCWETLMEMSHPPAAFAQAYSAFRRAQNAERKARSAAHLAKFADVPAAPPAPPARRRQKAKATFADSVRARWADEAEAVAA